MEKSGTARGPSEPFGTCWGSYLEREQRRGASEGDGGGRGSTGQDLFILPAHFPGQVRRELPGVEAIGGLLAGRGGQSDSSRINWSSADGPAS